MSLRRLRWAGAWRRHRSSEGCPNASPAGNYSAVAPFRGWFALGTAGRLVGHIYIHNGDDSGFVCETA